MISFLIFRLVLKINNEFVEVLALLSSAFTLFCVIKNFKVSSIICSFFYLPSYFLVMHFSNDYPIWFVTYLVVVVVVINIEKYIKKYKTW